MVDIGSAADLHCFEGAVFRDKLDVDGIRAKRGNRRKPHAHAKPYRHKGSRKRHGKPGCERDLFNTHGAFHGLLVVLVDDERERRRHKHQGPHQLKALVEQLDEGNKKCACNELQCRAHTRARK